MHSIAFESYGVRFRLLSNRRRTLDRAARVAHTAMVGQLREIDPGLGKYDFTVIETSDDLVLQIDGEHVNSNTFRRGFYHYFSSRLKMLVAEFADDVVFVHAGVVGWKGKAVMFPANSHEGKSTLTAALIRRGAEYLSDDYAIVDREGLIHPFPRKLSIRGPLGSGEWEDVPPRRFGGIVGDKPLPLGAAILTRYEVDSRWDPVALSQGSGMLQMVPFVIPLNANPEMSLSLLKNALTPAIIAQSFRPDISTCADEILTFIDNNV